jgi:hypothetical protein
MLSLEGSPFASDVGLGAKDGLVRFIDLVKDFW